MMGYVAYFVFVMVATIPSFIVCWKAPFHHDDGTAEPANAPQTAAT
jgi:PAT family beta-lactamase induction signal transducer AmpG